MPATQQQACPPQLRTGGIAVPQDPPAEGYAKYFYNFWRPVTAIRAGDTDGNPETAPDPAWIGVVTTPNHPEYPAAHGCFSGASTETLNYLFGTDEVRLSVDSNVVGIVNPVRTYERLSDALQEVLDARIYGGMHYRNSTRVGAKLGGQVSRFTTRHFFRPAKHHGHEMNDSTYVDEK